MQTKIKNQNPFLVDRIVYNKDYAIQRLKEVFKKGDTVFTQLYHVSQSGMTRHIGIRQLSVNDDNTVTPLNWSYMASLATGYRLNKNGDGLVVGGCGMDMGFHAVYTLSSILYNDGYALKQRWL